MTHKQMWEIITEQEFGGLLIDRCPWKLKDMSSLLQAKGAVRTVAAAVWAESRAEEGRGGCASGPTIM